MSKFYKVLLVEDDPITILICKRIIQFTGFSEEVIALNNGQEALHYLHQMLNQTVEKMPEIIFLDLNMPVMNGWEFLDQFMVLLPTIEKPPLIYILSSTIDEGDRLRGLSYDCVKDFISKPLTKEFLDKINL